MLCGAITSVQGQEPHVREIIVVIDYNASLLRRIGATFPEIRVLSNSAKQGYPGARKPVPALRAELWLSRRRRRGCH